MGRLYVLLFLLQIALAAAALISCLSTEEEDIAALPRLVWILIILFFPLIGSIAWFAAGRARTTPRRTWRPGNGFAEYDRPRAPDDDPDFLRSLRDRPLPPPSDRPSDRPSDPPRGQGLPESTEPDDDQPKR